MEASQEPPSKSDSVFLSPEVIQRHISNGMPVEPETAKWIWLMNHALHLPGESNPEIAKDGDW